MDDHSPTSLHGREINVTLWADLLTFLIVGTAFTTLLLAGKQWTSPLQTQVEIDLSLWSLPKYTFISLGRGFAAYLLSLAFTIVYGTIAAHHPRAERWMIPALDVLQAIPVLGFLPGVLLALMALFPSYGIGLELTSILMVFTGQVWNMTFSFHASLRSIPTPLREVAEIERLNSWQVFRYLEFPSAIIGLVWNSMMSMAGGWFFLTVTEAFTLHNQDFRLPGIGAYMNEAIHQQDYGAMVAAVVAMTFMIVLVDQVLWRPLVVWSQRFKLEEVGGQEPPRSWVLDLLSRSYTLRLFRFHRRLARQAQALPLEVPWRAFWKMFPWSWLGKAFLIAVFLGSLWGAGQFLQLLASLPISNPRTHEDWLTVLLALGASFLRTTAAVVLGAMWTIPLGIWIGLSPKLSNRMQPLIQIVASFPAPMIFPLITLLLTWLKIPFTFGCVVLMTLGTQWYILFNVIAGAQAIPADLKEVANSFRLGSWQRWKQLYLPAVFPACVTGLITAAGGAWNATIVSEYVYSRGVVHSAFGLGSLINHATAESNYPLLTAGVVTMAAFVVFINRTVWKKLSQLAQERYLLLT